MNLWRNRAFAPARRESHRPTRTGRARVPGPASRRAKDLGGHRLFGRPLANNALLFRPAKHAATNARRGRDCRASACAGVPGPLPRTESHVFAGADADFHPAAAAAMVDARRAARELLGDGHEVVDQESIVVVKVEARRVAGVPFGKQIGQRCNLVPWPATAALGPAIAAARRCDRPASIRPVASSRRASAADDWRWP